ncbi:putative transcriptional regulator [Roseibium alexandrii DFL-11]|uniref:Putative transcriptional regulator n=2 Tax=Roseibium alexandrii TaxID=388408 RepID=A0A5E8UXM2_ROSAD|nr:putative transcriptional regulator [Roseibium alexandrii DFL-11]
MNTHDPALLPLPSDDDTLIRRADVQAYLGIAPQTLARWAHEGQGPRFIKMGSKLVAYRAGDLRRWLETCQISSTI